MWDGGCRAILFNFLAIMGANFSMVVPLPCDGRGFACRPMRCLRAACPASCRACIPAHERYLFNSCQRMWDGGYRAILFNVLAIMGANFSMVVPLPCDGRGFACRSGGGVKQTANVGCWHWHHAGRRERATRRNSQTSPSAAIVRPTTSAIQKPCAAIGCAGAQASQFGAMPSA